MRGRRKRKKRMMRMVQMSIINGNNNGAFVKVYDLSDRLHCKERAGDRLRYSNRYEQKELVSEELPVCIRRYIRDKPLVVVGYKPRNRSEIPLKIQVSLDFVTRNVREGELEQLEDLDIVS